MPLRRPPLWASLFTGAGIIVLCTLGTWQLHRLAWKTEILRALEAAHSAPGTAPLDFKTLAARDFTYGRAHGRPLADKAFLFGLRMKDGQPGADLIVPLRTDQGDLLVDWGWVPKGPLENQPALRGIKGTLTIEGLARKPSWTQFTPRNIPERDVWYKMDIVQIAQAKALNTPAPAILYAERISPKPGNGLPDNEPFRPANNHLQYAIFWYAMAVILTIVYAARFLRPPPSHD
jgi:surfeit locus 1 family protein